MTPRKPEPEPDDYQDAMMIGGYVDASLVIIDYFPPPDDFDDFRLNDQDAAAWGIEIESNWGGE